MPPASVRLAFGTPCPGGRRLAGRASGTNRPLQRGQRDSRSSSSTFNENASRTSSTWARKQWEGLGFRVWVCGWVAT